MGAGCPHRTRNIKNQQRKETVNSNNKGARPPTLTARVDELAGRVAELRDGQDELLRMFEELRTLYPANCLCADRRAEAAKRELLAEDVLGNATAHEEYRPQ
jgi:hypothetical protein